MPQNCLGAIRSFYPRFSEKEKKIADYILEKPEVIIHRTINEVADDLNIADATVFRFSKRIGFKGFQAMKIALASETMAQKKPALGTSQEKDHKKALTEIIFKANINTLQNTLENIEGSAIQKAIDIISKANRVEIYGTGPNSVIAMSVSQKFLNSGIRAYAFIDHATQLLSASRMTSNDVAILLYTTETSKETLAIFETVNTAGAKTIAITEQPNSPISVNATLALSIACNESNSYLATAATQIAYLSLIDALCFSFFNLTKDAKVIPNMTVN